MRSPPAAGLIIFTWFFHYKYIRPDTRLLALCTYIVSRCGSGSEFFFFWSEGPELKTRIRIQVLFGAKNCHKSLCWKNYIPVRYIRKCFGSPKNVCLANNTNEIMLSLRLCCMIHATRRQQLWSKYCTERNGTHFNTFSGQYQND